MNRGLIGALSTSVALALLAGCGGSQVISAPGAMPHVSSMASSINDGDTLPSGAHRIEVVARGASGGGASAPLALERNLPATADTAAPLVYVSGPSRVYVFAYPSGNFVQAFAVGINGNNGLCSDKDGNVFVIGRNYIVEYAHGGTSPIAKITEPTDLDAEACSVDAGTGNLAVLNLSFTGVVLSVYPDAQGTPTDYTVPNMDEAFGAAYDQSGDIFVDGSGKSPLQELPRGETTFTPITISNGKLHVFGSLQCASNALLIASKQDVYQLQISGSVATIVRTTHATGGKPHTWVYDNTLIAPYGPGSKEIGFWKYPKGGKPTKILAQISGYFKQLDGVTVSALPSL
jgi:hypothetical protein